MKFPGLNLLGFFLSVKGDQLMLLSDEHCRHHQCPGSGFSQQLILGIPADCQPNAWLFSAVSRCCCAPQFPCWREQCWDNPQPLPISGCCIQTAPGCSSPKGFQPPQLPWGTRGLHKTSHSSGGRYSLLT